MTITELSAALESIKAEHGDLPAYFVTDDWGGLVDITWASPDLLPRCLEFDEHRAVVLR